MSVIRRGRSLARRGLRVQRRIALAQFLFWPGLIGAGLVVGVALLKRVRDGAEGRHHHPVDAAI
ncbi:hypothetical protein [Mycolicibacterium austroafricanum]|uniref:hypothetical protein n=1 Tax=Mycolicibacterium austroafricanum TaxID=39687 RepID=UPI001CA341D0|nr:hypothetical protein [Mycolicibacterium austroafricanum]QZT64466.1 hypothetical protein JN085_09170 [Mycolicibacterium austroafricanum]